MSNVICIFGDSITWGAWDFEMGGWVNRLKLYFDKQPEAEIRVYNLGISGDKLGDVLKRIDAEAKARLPIIIILAVGINDTPHPENINGTGLEKFAEQFKELIKKAQNFTQKIIILGLTNVDEKNGDHGYINNEVSKYNEKMKLLAKNKNFLFIDLFGILTVDEFADGLHPNTKGHQKIFEKVKESLLPSIDF